MPRPLDSMCSVLSGMHSHLSKKELLHISNSCIFRGGIGSAVLQCMKHSYLGKMKCEKL